ncbi:MAG: thioredoxin domain-containing protein [Spirochaetes bacterium]|nr:thioredoxin domain-containing protein [Spirochaetota bacterium]
MHNNNKKRSNRLSGEKSPYLLQHSENPVNWHPWSNEAFNKASRENRPVFLSIGYSTCHWCHVMEKESFEDDKVAMLLNSNFVSIKVDREERPDIDNIYMNVCTMLTGYGGWPLTIIMTPEKKPFFAATYIPKDTRWGRTGLLELLPKITDIWNTRKDEIYKSADEIISALKKTEKSATGEDIDTAIYHKTLNILKNNFDSVYGGFGKAPKFPSTHNLLFLLHYRHFFKDNSTLDMVEKTLKEMRLGGIFDQIGYGFHRYSTDEKWRVPHFEKMLYDQAMMTIAYLEVYLATGNNFYAETAEEILDYVLRCMTAENGGFFSAEDADSEGLEGRFYLWKEKEINEKLSRIEAEIAKNIFNLNSEGNFIDETIPGKTGENIPYQDCDISALSEKMNISAEELKKKSGKIRKRLYDIRSQRIHPHKDDKILTDWNGLMIAAFARAGRVLDNNKYTNAALKASDFIKQNLCKRPNTLLHRYRDGDAAIEANLDDYAFYAWGLIELYESTFNAEFLKTAVELTEKLIELFYDEKSGLLYFSAENSEDHIARSSILYDSAIPSGNSVAFYNIIRLRFLTEDERWKMYAETIAAHTYHYAKKNPSGYTMFLYGLLILTQTATEIIVAGSLSENAVKELFKAVNSLYLPNAVILHNPVDQGYDLIHQISPDINSKIIIDGKPAVYICQDFKCSRPVTDKEKMIQLLSG